MASASGCMKLSEVHPSLVCKRHASSMSMHFEYPVQFAQHPLVLRMPRPRRVRRRQQPPFSARIIKFLLYRKHVLLIGNWVVEFIHSIGSPLVPYVCVVGTE